MIAPSTTAAMLFDMGFAAEHNAVLALITFAKLALPRKENSLHERRVAALITDDLLSAATAGGFTAPEEFQRLVGQMVDGEDLAPALEDLALDVVRHAGGAEQFFLVLELASTPHEHMGARQ